MLIEIIRQLCLYPSVLYTICRIFLYRRYPNKPGEIINDRTHFPVDRFTVKSLPFWRHHTADPLFHIMGGYLAYFLLPDKHREFFDIGKVLFRCTLGIAATS